MRLLPIISALCGKRTTSEGFGGLHLAFGHDEDAHRIVSESVVGIHEVVQKRRQSDKEYGYSQHNECETACRGLHQKL
jgi:hypothetical protein